MKMGIGIFYCYTSKETRCRTCSSCTYNLWNCYIPTYDHIWVQFKYIANDKNWKLSIHSLSLVNSMTFLLIRYGTFVCPNLIWLARYLFCPQNFWWLAIIMSPENTTRFYPYFDFCHTGINFQFSCQSRDNISYRFY